jgi:hypothetical protein
MRDRVSFALLVVGYASVAAYVAGQVWASLDAASLERASPFDARWVGVPGAVCAAAEAGRTLMVASQGQDHDSVSFQGDTSSWPLVTPLHTSILLVRGTASRVRSTG